MNAPRSEQLHVKYANSEHCQEDGEPWPCLVSRLLAERHSTNEALDEAVRALRVQRDQIAELEGLELGAVDSRVSAACGNPAHPTWLRKPEDTRRCPWCRIAELEGAAICPSVARVGGSKCVLPVRHRGDHRDETKRHYWSDDYAVPQQRQQEDPHTSPLHQTFALGRDDLRFSAAEIARWQARHGVVPQQTTGRCPRCRRLFEDCTCGGAA
jgi:hypothetical protein